MPGPPGWPADTVPPAASVLDFGADPSGVKGSAAAINAALAAHWNVLAPCGTYRLETSVRLRSGRVLRGAGPCTIFAVPDRGFVGERVITNADVARGNRDITISDFALRVTTPKPVSGTNPGIVRFQRVDGLTVERIHTDSYASEYDIIHLAGGVRNATVRGCKLRNAQATRAGGGVGVFGGPEVSPTLVSQDVVVTGNDIETSTDEAVIVYGWFNSVRNVRVTGNKLVNRGPSEVAAGIMGSNFGQGGVAEDVIFSDNVIVGKTNILTGARKIRFVGNRITGPSAAGQDAIFLAAARGAVPDGVLLEGNTIRGASRYGVYSDASNVVLRKNDIEGTASYGIYGGTVVEGNSVRGVGTIGIHPTRRSSMVRGNTVAGTAYGIASFGDVSGLALLENVVVDATSAGISVNGDGTTIRGMVIRSNEVRATPGVRTARGISTQNGRFIDCVAAGNRISGASEPYALATGWNLVR